jgi:hypothetical protein
MIVGDGDYVNCGYDPIFDIATDKMTVSAWVTIRANANAWQVIAAKGEYAWRFGDEWYHVAGVFDGLKHHGISGGRS